MNGSFRKILLLSAVVVLLNPAPSQAGFWKKNMSVESVSDNISGSSVDLSYLQSNGISAEAFVAKDFSAHKAIARKGAFADRLALFFANHVPSRGVAIAMAMLDLVVPLGFARFSLGYKGKGALQAALAVIGIVGAILLATSFYEPDAMMFLPGALMIALGIFSYVWQVVDNIRILADKLRPKAGYWRPKRPGEP